jgi:hypothetical protein
MRNGSFSPELTRADRFLQVLNRRILAVSVVFLVMQPAELLEDLGVIRIPVEHPPVRQFGVIVLFDLLGAAGETQRDFTHICVLFIDMSNLEPDIFFRQRGGRDRTNVSEALHSVSGVRLSGSHSAAYLKTLLVLLLLFVDYAKSEVYLIGLFKIWRHAHDLRERLLGMFK